MLLKRIAQWLTVAALMVAVVATSALPAGALILDDGAEEYAIRPPAEDAEALMELFEQTGTIYFAETQAYLDSLNDDLLEEIEAAREAKTRTDHKRR